MHHRFPVATALKESFKGGYGGVPFRADLGAGLVVSLVALPLAMALSVAVGLPPQHGLYTAIIAGIVTALLGGSRFQVSGPTAAFVAILVPIIAQYGLEGLILCQLMAGVLLILLGLLRFGKFIRLVPYAVTTGFTAGIAIVIATLALNDFLGLNIDDPGDRYWTKVGTIFSSLAQATPQEAVIGILSLVIMIVCPRITKRLPAAVMGIGAGTILGVVAVKAGLPVETIATRFSYTASDGTVGAGIPPSLPQFHLPAMIDLTPLLIPAVTVALLAALESLLSAAVADNVTGTEHDPDAELVGIGFGNLLTGFFAGIPATGALARTATNIHAGAQTPMAAVYHALFLLAFMMALAPYISAIPMAALAALLLSVAWRMAHAHLVVKIIRQKNYRDTMLVLVTLILTVIFDMVVGVGVGLALAYICHVWEKRRERGGGGKTAA